MLPKYPIYVPTKGRSDTCYTAKFLLRDEVPFKLVVEPAEQQLYADKFGCEHLLVMPRDNMRLIGARNWIKEHATASGAKRHWQLDDNITCIFRRTSEKNIKCAAGPAFAATEDFVDRFTNVAVAGLNYEMFVLQKAMMPPFLTNVHVYSCTLILNSIPHKWRLIYNDDTDLCLQVLADGWCTILVNAFSAKKLRTMTVKGGNTSDLYQGDGRLRMARELERMWPGVVYVDRRFKRPQHVIKANWRRFTTALQLADGVDLTALEEKDYGLMLEASDKLASEKLKALQKKWDS